VRGPANGSATYSNNRAYLLGKCVLLLGSVWKLKWGNPGFGYVIYIPKRL
jgi:hypothetical protein